MWLLPTKPNNDWRWTKQGARSITQAWRNQSIHHYMHDCIIPSFNDWCTMLLKIDCSKTRPYACFNNWCIKLIKKLAVGTVKMESLILDLFTPFHSFVGHVFPRWWQVLIILLFIVSRLCIYIARSQWF